MPRIAPAAGGIPALRSLRRQLCWPARWRIFARGSGASVYIAANGGYRSPAHRLSATASAHNWAAAADIYRIGDTFLNTHSAIEKYGALAREMAPEINVLPYGHQPGESDDHLHLDLGYVHLVPPGCDESMPPA